jgi:glucan biosynthesis protein
MDEYQKVLTRIKKSLTTEESLIELIILLGLSYKQRVKIEDVQENYRYENVFKPLIIDIDSLELEKEKIAQLIGDVGIILANVQTPF